MNTTILIERAPKNYYSKEVAKDQEGSSIRRCTKSVDKLLSVPEEGVTTLYEAFLNAVERNSSRPCFGNRKLIKHHEEVQVTDQNLVMTYPQLGPYVWKTYKEVLEFVRYLSSGLRHIGLSPGGKLAIYLETSIEWSLMSRACHMQNITIFTVYANLGEDTLIYAMSEGEIDYMFTHATNLAFILNIIDQLPTLKHIVYSGEAKPEDVANLRAKNLMPINFEELGNLGRNNPLPSTPPTPEDIGCIMYTSGTTGRAKGVLMKHSSLVAAITGQMNCFTITQDDVFLSYLPMSHVFAFVTEQTLTMAGASIGFGSARTLSARGVRHCRGDIKELQPSIFIGVPTILERIKQSILNELGDSNWLKKVIFKQAYQSKLDSIHSGSFNSFWEKVVFNNIKSSLGKRLRVIACGAAPLSSQLQDFIRVCFGVPVLQGYGLTETCSAGALQMVEDTKTNSIGAPLCSIEMKLRSVPLMSYTINDKPCPRGEICIRGPVICSGYYKCEEGDFNLDLTPDGWLCTGDIGMLNQDGSFSVVDRKKNLIKPPHGEYIALEKLESIYLNSVYVDNIMVYVDSYHHHCIAFVVPNQHALKMWTSTCSDVKGVKTFAELCEHPAVVQRVLQDLQNTGKNLRLKSIEIIRAVAISSEPWTPENFYLTASMKLNRMFIVGQVKDQIQALYDHIPAQTRRATL